MNYSRKDVTFIGGCCAVVTVALWRSAKIHRSEKKKRAEIRRQAALDIQAINLASNVVLERMKDPEYMHKGLSNMMDDFSTEIAFQKIVVREDKDF